jgi:methyltransferase
MIGGIGIGPAVLLAVMIGQRLGELYLSAKHLPWIRAHGGREYGAGHFPFIVLVHVLFPVLFLIEITHHAARPGALWPFWLALFVAAQALRYAAISALGQRWSARIFVIPGLPLVRTGPYRWLRHPNYIAVVVEFLAAPMIFGAWRTAIAVGILNAVVLWVRVRCETGALVRAAAGKATPPEAKGEC